ncbi:hypothetical protein JOD63_001206 [Microbacterium terrae]|uniref:DUF4233 domain-containing protein n=1 Tax=Microbacterium terrae TaxID=69369 RepID=A0A0M2HKW7_9MICO|nr:DUF4233 domain-containing protein [Microbacterium terrae]KJL45041.1 hypothetical protein RS81_00351 [Microbacterium terrae]MBP1077238.1 hypothetical protein [Microbacterium terrae]GLJ99831.1 hypothetical protein GCM10017594_30290 [Microbacterium terrae]
MSGAAVPAPAPRARRPRGAAESLASIVLGSESLIAFLGGLVIYGMDDLPGGIPAWWGIVAGVGLALLMLVTAGLTRYRWGIALGWALQVVVALGAFLVPALAIVAVIFGLLYGYATIKGAALDKRNARLAASSLDEAETANGD